MRAALLLLALFLPACLSPASRAYAHAQHTALLEGIDWDALPPEEQAARLDDAQAELLEEETGDVLDFLPEPVRTPAKGAAGLLFYLLARKRSRQHLLSAAKAVARGRLPTALKRVDAACGGRHTSEFREVTAEMQGLAEKWTKAIREYPDTATFSGNARFATAERAAAHERALRAVGYSSETLERSGVTYNSPRAALWCAKCRKPVEKHFDLGIQAGDEDEVAVDEVHCHGQVERVSTPLAFIEARQLAGCGPVRARLGGPDGLLPRIAFQEPAS